MSPRRWLAGLLALAVFAGCSPSGGKRTGPGGIRYQWPPPAAQTHGPPSAGRFCALLIDDYQHLKTLQTEKSLAGKTSIAGDYVRFAPILEAAAPAGIAPATKTYVGSVSALISALAHKQFDIVEVPRPTIDRLSQPVVSAAAAELIGYSTEQCHYDLAAHSAPNG